MGLLQRTDLTASFFTLTGSVFGEPPRHALNVRAAAAAGAGFSGLALAPEELKRWREAGGDLPGLAAIVERYGLVVTELEPLRDWDGDGATARAARADELAMYEMAAMFGSRQINAIQVVDDEVGDELVTERFAALCERAAPHGLIVAFEPRANSPVSTPARAAQLIRAAGSRNAGIVLDSYHFHRAGVTLTDLGAVPAELIASIQLNDMHAQPHGSPAEDALQHRLAPGDGDIDLAAWLSGLDKLGIDSPLAVEVISRDFARLEADEAAGHAAAGAFAALAAARAL